LGDAKSTDLLERRYLQN